MRILTSLTAAGYNQCKTVAGPLLEMKWGPSVRQWKIKKWWGAHWFWVWTPVEEREYLFGGDYGKLSTYNYRAKWSPTYLYYLSFIFLNLNGDLPSGKRHKHVRKRRLKHFQRYLFKTPLIMVESCCRRPLRGLWSKCERIFP